MLYSHMQYHNDTIIKTQEDFFNKICTSHFIVRVRKGYSRFYCERELEIKQNCNILTPPHSYGRQRCVFFVLQGCSTGGPGARLSAECWLSLLHLISNFSGPQLNREPWAPSAWPGFPYHISSITPSDLCLQLQLIRGSKSPFGLMWLSLPHLVYNSVRSLTATSVLTELYNSPTPTQSPTRFLESHVWSSLSGNNCHAVHRSLSSGASVYECTMGIFLPRPISSANFRPRDFLSKLPLKCVTSFRCITLEWHFWPGRRSKYNNGYQYLLTIIDWFSWCLTDF